MSYSTLHFLMLLGMWVSAASLAAFALLVTRPQARKQAFVGLAGSAPLLSGLLGRQFFHDVGAMILLEAVGALLLFLSSLLALQRRYS